MPRDITERPHAPSGVAAFMSAHSKTPCVTPSMGHFSGNGVVGGAAAARMYLAQDVITCNAGPTATSLKAASSTGAGTASKPHMLTLRGLVFLNWPPPQPCALRCVCILARPRCPREITERPHAHSGVAAFMSASKTPCVNPSMNVSSGKG